MNHVCPDCRHVLDDPDKMQHAYNDADEVEVKKKVKGGMVHAEMHVDGENNGLYCE